MASRRPSGGTSGTRRTVLPGGLRVVTEQVPGVESASMGVWLDVGSRDETPALAGASHFLEHLLFKGTKRRTALDIASELDAVGGESNAFTTRDHTCFYARVRAKDLPLAVDVLADMITSATVTSADVEAERAVVLDEIAMNEDDPADLCDEHFISAVYGDHPLARPVIGSVSSINQLSRTQIAGYYRRRYRPASTVVSVAGKVEHDEVVGLVKKAFAADGWMTGATKPSVAQVPPASVVQPHRGALLRWWQAEQSNVMIGGPGLTRFDARRYAFGLLNTVLGGGMSSRLFQEVREKRGLAYSVYSLSSSYADAGMWAVSSGCAPARLSDLIHVIRDVVTEVANNGVTQDELDRAKGQTIGGFVLGMEDTESRMTRIGRAELLRGDEATVADWISKVEAVTLHQVADVAKEILSDISTAVVVGPHSVAEVRAATGMTAKKINGDHLRRGRVS